MVENKPVLYITTALV